MTRLALSVLAVVAFGVSVGNASAAGRRTLVLYSVAQQEQYVNNSDSRTLGVGNNPFGNFKDVGPVTSKKSHGPFPGDEALFSFNLYSDATVHKRVGTAVFTCQYNFAKNAFCDARFRLANGDTVLATGGFNFNAAKFTLAVPGGSGRFAEQIGTVDEAPSANHAQRLVFHLAPAKSAGAERLSFYSVPRKLSYINNIDDVARGQGVNPFGNYNGSAAPLPKNEKVFGPFPGDEGEYAFDLYGGADRKTKLGTSSVVCQYDFNQGSFCDAALKLKDGTLIAKGSFNFNAKTFSLAVVGGTDRYRAARGHIDVAAVGIGTQPQPVRRAVPMRQAQRLRAVVHPGKPNIGLTRFSLPANETFVGNLDDETRAAGNNPFGVRLKGMTHVKESDGPFPGDEALFSFKLFANASLTGNAGSAVYTCWYTFAKDAFCDATFQLPGGTIIAAGSLSFGGQTFSLAVTGGSGSYAGATGELKASASGKHAQRLAFVP